MPTYRHAIRNCNTKTWLLPLMEQSKR